LPDGLSGIFLREEVDRGFRKSASDLPVGQSPGYQTRTHARGMNGCVVWRRSPV
jgi:hypothetical protein